MEINECTYFSEILLLIYSPFELKLSSAFFRETSSEDMIIWKTVLPVFWDDLASQDARTQQSYLEKY